MGKFKRTIHNALRNLGYDITSFPPADRRFLEGHLIRVLLRLGITCVIDVGAHHGEYGSLLRGIGYEGWILSFEPVSTNFKFLKARSADDPKWITYNFALGDENGTSLINVHANSVFSSFLSINAFGCRMFEGEVIVERSERVDVRRLDDIFDEITGAIPEPKIYLKIDTQGCDMRVIKGGAGHLDQIVALQSEVSVYRIYDEMPDYLSALQEMTRLGYVLTGLFPVTRFDDELRSIEFDCIMVRDSSIIRR